MELSTVIPTLNAAGSLAAAIRALGSAPREVIVSDGGSRDETTRIALDLGATVIHAPVGRGSQIAAGIAASRGAWILILHADTRLEAGWAEEATAFARTQNDRAAYFRFALESADPRARRLERLVAFRCRHLGLPYGDQGLLIARRLLDDVGGVRPIPLMEDVELVQRIGCRRLVGLQAAAVTSATKWERQGWNRRSLHNLSCLALYFAGVPPRVIQRLYT